MIQAFTPDEYVNIDPSLTEEPGFFTETTSLESIVRASPWPDELHPALFRLMTGESRLVATAVSYNGCCHGLLQINTQPWLSYCGLQSVEELYDPRKNLECGWKIYLYDKYKGHPEWNQWEFKP